jgi:hypothetical protein
MQDSEPFPLISDTIKSLRIKLAEAEWEKDEENAKKLREEITEWLYTISLGEKYHVPF